MAAVTVRCAGCDMRWDVAPKPDGSMPVTARCPRERGGCGKVKKVPRRAASPAPAAAPGWEPRSVPRAARQTAEQCPGCGQPGLLASPRNTVRACPQCNNRVPPAGVTAPYDRAAAGQRQVKSQRDTDLEALDLARRKGIMRGQLDDIAADDRLTPESRAVVEWFAEQVKAASTGQRLDDLAGLFTAQKVRRRRWWQGAPTAITAGQPGDDDEEEWDEDEEQEDDEGQEDDDTAGPGTAVPAIPGPMVMTPAGQLALPVPATPASIAGQRHQAQPQRMTWAEAVTACGWRLSPAVGGCQVIEEGHPCRAGTTASIGYMTWACAWHYDALCRVIMDANRARGLW